MAVSLVAIGFPAGGLVGGLLSAYLLANFGWPAIFWTASLIGLVMVAVTWAWLRDPVAVVIARPGRNGLARVNDFLRRCGHAEVDSLPPSPIEAAAPMRALFASEMRSSTLKITLIYFLVVIPVFFMQTWLPTFISDLGVAPAASALIAAFFNVGGILAGMAVAAISLRAGLRTLLNLAQGHLAGRTL